ncbi:hypothetical protein BDZ89DRAFT_1171520 [Hymenopellis radicata]|nr:hypothetical protein BDZ89DRAFT_1171520 [Hymenopellis radicata]
MAPMAKQVPVAAPTGGHDSRMVDQFIQMGMGGGQRPYSTQLISLLFRRTRARASHASCRNPSATHLQCYALAAYCTWSAIMSQALIFVPRSHGFFFVERPSAALFCGSTSEVLRAGALTGHRGLLVVFVLGMCKSMGSEDCWSVRVATSTSATDFEIDDIQDLVDFASLGVSLPNGTQVHGGFLKSWNSVAEIVISAAILATISSLRTFFG